MFMLPQLPYTYDALEPYIDEQTMKLHHDKHHQAYVDKLNAALDGSELGEITVFELMAQLDKVPEDMRTTVRNNGGGHANHTFFWEIMAPNGSRAPDGALADAIHTTFGSFDTFKEKFAAAATGQFGSGWAWLVKDGRTLRIEATPNQDNPWMTGRTPVLGIDVWEHAYYLKYHNRRPEYIDAWWHVVNWAKAAEYFSK